MTRTTTKLEELISINVLELGSMAPMFQVSLLVLLFRRRLSIWVVVGGRRSRFWLHIEQHGGVAADVPEVKREIVGGMTRFFCGILMPICHLTGARVR